MTTFGHWSLRHLELVVSFVTALLILFMAAAFHFSGGAVTEATTLAGREAELARHLRMTQAILVGGSIGVFLFGWLTAFFLRQALLERDAAQRVLAERNSGPERANEPIVEAPAGADADHAPRAHAEVGGLLEPIVRANTEIDHSLHVHVDDSAPIRLGGPCSCSLVDTPRGQQAEEREQLVEALARSHEELDRLAYVMAHDLKAPLRSIANLATWIEEDLGESTPTEIREHLRLLSGRVYRMESLINGILEYARAGRLQEPLVEVDVGGLIADVVELLEAPAECRIDVAPGMPMLRTHRPALRRVFTNLMANAIKHARRDDPTIRIGARNLGWAYEFFVSDDGPGIQPRFHERIFDIFTTLESRDKEENTGMGLAVVKKIVETVGGGIRIESQEGQGARFLVTWPKNLPKEQTHG